VFNISIKILRFAMIAGLLFGITVPAFTANAPKTKAECAKLDNMKWDTKTQNVRAEVISLRQGGRPHHVRGAFNLTVATKLL